jgi:S-formylglutathione hydrolase FrmB
MGGYGALKWALRRPLRFAAAASLSGAVHLGGLRTQRARPEDPRLFERIFGDRPIAGGPDDIFWLLQQAELAALPALFVGCGTEDELIGDNRALAEACSAVGLPITTDFGPGEHDWAYWDDQIQRVLAWLPLRGAAEPGDLS